MTHFRINALERCFEAELARQTRINQLQDSKWTEFEYGARQSLEWVGNFRAAQCEVNVEHENNTESLRARCARLENFVDSEITKLKEKCARLEYWVNSGADDRVTQQALERRVEALEHLLTIDRRENKQLKNQIQAQAHILGVLEARIDALGGNQHIGRSAQSYQVDGEIGPSTNSNKKV